MDDPKRYVVAEGHKEGYVLSIEEKPMQPKSNYAVVGVPLSAVLFGQLLHSKAVIHGFLMIFILLEKRKYNYNARTLS